MKRSPLRRKTRASAAAPLKRGGRPKAETLRIYGPPERREWIRSLPCLVCGYSPCENAHSTGGGMGRKAGFETIVPLCIGCHGELHQYGVRSFEERYAIDLKLAAETIHAMWLLNE